MNVDVRLLQLYYGCSKKFDREHKKNSYAGNDRSFAVSRYIGHIITVHRVDRRTVQVTSPPKCLFEFWRWKKSSDGKSFPA